MTGRLRAAGCVFAEDEARLLVRQAGTADELDAMVEARAGGVPLEYVLGWAEFCGLRITVEPGVFVPRRRTEFLAGRAVSQARALPGTVANGSRPLVVLDVCCGTGALGVAVADRLGAVELHAVDVDPVAVRCAARNLGPAGTVYHGDLFAPLPSRLRGSADVVLVNVPYVPSAQIPLLPAEARDHEARTALDGGADGLDVLRRVAGEVLEWLAPKGFVLVEVSRDQASAAAAAFAAGGLTAEVLMSDDPPAAVVLATGRRDVARR